MFEETHFSLLLIAQAFRGFHFFLYIQYYNNVINVNMMYCSYVDTSCQYIYFCYQTHMHIDLEN